MENILTGICIISIVGVFILILFFVQYYEKDTLLSLIGYFVSAVLECALEIAKIMLSSKPDNGNVLCLCVFIIILLTAIYCMIENLIIRKKILTQIMKILKVSSFRRKLYKKCD